jgi:hypothetical protein
MDSRKIPATFLFIALSASSAYGEKQPIYHPVEGLTPEQEAVVQMAIGQEKILINNIRQRTPLVETYIQDTRSDVKLNRVPVADTYMLSRVDFGKAFYNTAYPARSEAEKTGWLKGSLASITYLTRALGLDTKFTYSPTGFMQMMFLDPSGFDSQHYQFSYVRRELLGTVRTWVFDVHPKVSGMGRFRGRVWIEDQDGNIVRFNGTFTPSRNEDSSKYYFHFDSWRMNVQPGIWLPVAVYVQESRRIEGNKSAGLKAQTQFWGYSLKLPARDSENVTVKVENAEDKSDDSQDMGPLEATREWVTQAENNVLDRLVQAGLVAPVTPNGFETTVLEQIVTKLAIPNNLSLSSPVHCRVLLTNTIESTTVGNSILVSKGLIDTMPRNEATIASVIALELAHIVLAHHTDTRYAFNDRLMFPDEASFQRINMYHTDHDNEEATKKAQEYLEASTYKDQLPTAGLFWAQLADRAQVLKQLNTPKLGDSLLRADGTPWMSQLAHGAPKLNWDDLTQIPALPLGSRLMTDPWDDRVHQLNAELYAPLNSRGKMPLEVTPVFYKVLRYSVSDDSRTPADAAPADHPAAGDPNGVPTQTTTPGQITTPPAAAVPSAPAEYPAHRPKTG